MNDSRSPRVVAGYGRSGTTWIQDVLAESNGLRPVFEPLHPKHIRSATEFAHSYRLEDEEDERLFALLYPFLCGGQSSLWADYRIDTTQLTPRLSRFRSWGGLKRYLRYLMDTTANIAQFRAQLGHPDRIIKFIRANMLLSWLKRKFEARIIFVIRHPGAVVLSQTQAPRAWRPMDQIERYRADARLLEALAEPFKELLYESHDLPAACALCWCIENSVALTQAAASGIPIVYYERLLRDSEQEWSAILSALELSTMPGAALIGRPSQQAWGEKATDARLISRYDSWMAKIDGGTASQIQHILDRTGMNMYNLSDPDPRDGRKQR